MIKQHTHRYPPSLGRLRRRELWLFAAPLLFLGFFYLPKLYFYFKPVEIVVWGYPEKFDSGWPSDNVTKEVMKQLSLELGRPIYSHARVFVVRWGVENPRYGRGGPAEFETGKYIYNRPKATLQVERTFYRDYRDAGRKVADNYYNKVTDDTIFAVVKANGDHEMLKAYGAE